jgi:hypothetical protein
MMSGRSDLFFTMFKKHVYQRVVATLLLSVILIQAFGFFNIPSQVTNIGMAFEVCTANGMILMHEDATTDDDTDSTQTPQRFQCVFCAMAQSLAAPLVAALILILGLLQTDVFYPHPYSFTLPEPAAWLQLPARAPPLSLH